LSREVKYVELGPDKKYVELSHKESFVELGHDESLHMSSGIFRGYCISYYYFM